jgi:hypothetical protein
MLASGLGSGTLLEGAGGPAAAMWGKGAGTLVTLRKLRQSIEADMQHEGDEPRRWWMMQPRTRYCALRSGVGSSMCGLAVVVSENPHSLHVNGFSIPFSFK